MTNRLNVWLPITLTAAVILYICAFKVGNTDFWWHIKAGQILRDTGWISTDPFAWTRVGQPYLASHEWLAQVILSGIYDVTGWQGITVLRFVLVALTFGIPLLLSRKHISVTWLVALLAAIGSRAAMSDRPHLFSFVLLSLVVCLCITYLEVDARKRKKILLLLPLVILLWTNLHGAASLIGIAVIGALFLDQLVHKGRGVGQLLGSLIACGIALLISPSGIGNISYVLSLFIDQSASLISEWQAVPLSQYLLHTLPLWVAAVWSIVRARKSLVFSSLVLLGLGYLSLQSGRHQALFLIAALALTIYQLRNSTIRVPRAVYLVACALVVLFCILQSHRFTVRDQNFGFGEFAPMRGAALFLQDQKPERMFNTYNAGGELLYHDLTVFLDGRNIDYGYDYMKRALDAGVDSTVWNAVDGEYDFTHAVIYYALEAHRDPMPYISILQELPNWSLVYLDEWAAVYAKNTEGYRMITPKMLMQKTIPEEIRLGDLQTLLIELDTIIDMNSEGVQAREYKDKLLQAFAR